MKIYYGGPIRTHKRSFERYHPRPPTASLPKMGVHNPNPKLQSPLSQELVKLRTANLADTFTGYPNKRPLKILEKKERGRIQGLPNFLSTPIISGMGKATN